MERVKVKKSELLEILQANRKKHKEEYKETIRAFRMKAADLFNKEYQKAISGKKFESSVFLSKPESHEKDYDLSIKMIQMSVDDIIELSTGEFNQLVNDEWSWRSSFSTARSYSAGYSGSSGMSGTSGKSGLAHYTNSTSFKSQETEDFTIEVKFADDELE